jgi:DNA primase
LSYDNDEAGQKAARKAIDILATTPLRIKVARLQGGKDPDEIIKKYGKDKMQQILSSAVGDVEFDLQRAKQGFDLQTSDGKVAYLGQAVEILSKLSNPIQWDVYASKLASELGVSKEAIVTQIEKKSRQKKNREKRDNFAKAATFNDETLGKVNPERQRNLFAAKAEETLIASLLHNPDFYFKIKDKVYDEDFATALNLRIYKLIARNLDENRPVGVTYFSQDLTDEESGYLVRLEMMRDKLGNTVKECLDCISRMKEEKQERENKNPARMSDDEWAKQFKKLSE